MPHQPPSEHQVLPAQPPCTQQRWLELPAAQAAHDPLASFCWWLLLRCPT